jgi:hypothetical protein
MANREAPLSQRRFPRLSTDCRIVQQVSGEDWSDVKLALSTASPSVGAYNPQLSPLFVSLCRTSPRRKERVREEFMQKARATNGF